MGGIRRPDATELRAIDALVIRVFERQLSRHHVSRTGELPSANIVGGRCGFELGDYPDCDRPAACNRKD